MPASWGFCSIEGVTRAKAPQASGPALRSDRRSLVTRPTGEKGLRCRAARTARPRNPPGAAGEKVAGIDRGRTVKPHAQPSDRRTSLGTAAADRSSPATRPARRGLDANVTKREDLGPRSRPHAANVTKREVFTARDPAMRGRLQQKPRIRVGEGARGPLSRRSGSEKLRVLLHMHQSGAAGARNLRVLLHLQQREAGRGVRRSAFSNKQTTFSVGTAVI